MSELRLIGLIILFSVISTTAVLSLTQGVKASLEDKTGALLGGDRAIISPIPLNEAILQKAQEYHLKTSNGITFFSMLVHDKDLALSDIQAVDTSYPLRGNLKTTHSIPDKGTVWLEPRLFSLLNIKIGDTLRIGEAFFTVTRVLTVEPGRVFEGGILAPKTLMNIEDVPLTDIIQPGSRISYTLLIAGNSANLAQFDDWMVKNIQPTQTYLNSKTNLNSTRVLIQRTEHFLGLFLIINILLASIAIAIASNRFSQLEVKNIALLRCLGVGFRWIFLRYTFCFSALGIIAGLIGLLLGYGLYKWATAYFKELLPSVFETTVWVPVGFGFSIVFLLLLGFGLPVFLNLRKITPLSIIRQDFPPFKVSNGLLMGISVLIIFLFLVFQIEDLKLTAVMTLFIFGIGLGSVVGLEWIFVFLRPYVHKIKTPWRIGFVNVVQAGQENAIQIVTFSLAMMMFWVLYLIKGDLLNTWLHEIPEKAPNYFALNIPNRELQNFETFLKDNDIKSEMLYPTLRARLLSVNEKAVDPAIFKRLLNITSSMTLQPDNKIIQGRWFQESDINKLNISVERGFSERLNIKLGDSLKFQIEESILYTTVISIREVSWNSFKPNFFVIFAPGALKGFSTSYMTSFYLRSEQLDHLKQMARFFPMISIIDIAGIMVEIKSIILTVSKVIQNLFLFTLVMAFLLMFSMLIATLDERKQEATLLHILGATHKQLAKILFSEFLCVGALSGFIAAIGSMLLSYWLADKVLKIAYLPQWRILVLGPLIGMLFIGTSGYLGTILLSARSVVRKSK